MEAVVLTVSPRFRGSIVETAPLQQRQMFLDFVTHI
jgi:hypothetical protein